MGARTISDPRAGQWVLVEFTLAQLSASAAWDSAAPSYVVTLPAGKRYYGVSLDPRTELRQLLVSLDGRRPLRLAPGRLIRQVFTRLTADTVLPVPQLDATATGWLAGIGGSAATLAPQTVRLRLWEELPIDDWGGDCAHFPSTIVLAQSFLAATAPAAQDAFYIYAPGAETVRFLGSNDSNAQGASLVWDFYAGRDSIARGSTTRWADNPVPILAASLGTLTVPAAADAGVPVSAGVVTDPCGDLYVVRNAAGVVATAYRAALWFVVRFREGC